MRNYPLADKDGNTPLLKCIPKTAVERNNIIEKIEEQLNYGTLVIEKVQVTTQKPILSGTLPNGKTIAFEEHPALGDNNCGFIVLGTDRNELSTTLLAFRDNEGVRNSITLEIFDAFFTTSIVRPYQIEEAFKTLEIRKNQLDNEVRSVTESTNFTIQDGFVTPEQQLLNQLNTNLELIAFDGKSFRTLASSLQTKVDDYNRMYSHILGLCSSPEIYEYYIKSYVTTSLWLGYQSAKLFCIAKKRNLYIWEKVNQSTQLKLRDCYEGGHLECTYMLHTNRYTHYNLLIELPPNQQTEKVVSSNTVITISHDFLNEENKYGHNLLHRAVRSIAADILVPYLLEKGFKALVNKPDIYGKTALHRAIKYFVDNENNRHALLMQELEKLPGDKIENFKNLCETTFVALIKAGANLWQRENSNDENSTPLSRAIYYNPRYQAIFKSPEFNLATWLKAKQAELFPNNQIAPPVKQTMAIPTSGKRQLPAQQPPIIPNPSRLPTHSQTYTTVLQTINRAAPLPPPPKQSQEPIAPSQKKAKQTASKDMNTTAKLKAPSKKSTKDKTSAQKARSRNSKAKNPQSVIVPIDVDNVPMSPAQNAPMTPILPNTPLSSFQNIPLLSLPPNTPFTPLPLTPLTPQIFSMTTDFFPTNPLNNTPPPQTPLDDEIEFMDPYSPGTQ